MQITLAADRGLLSCDLSQRQGEKSTGWRALGKSRERPGSVPGISRPGESWERPGSVPEMSRKCRGPVPGAPSGLRGHGSQKNPQTVLALRGSSLFSKELGLGGGLAAMSSPSPPRRRLVAARRGRPVAPPRAIESFEWNRSNPTNCNPIDCNPIDCTPIDCSPIDCNPIDCNQFDCNPIDCIPIDCNPIDCNQFDCNPMGCNRLQRNCTTLLVPWQRPRGEKKYYSAILVPWQRLEIENILFD